MAELDVVSPEEEAEFERKKAEERKWSAIGRKVGEFKAGDIVECTGSYGGHSVGTIGILEYDPRWSKLRVRANGDLKSHTGQMRLIAPFDSLFNADKSY